MGPRRRRARISAPTLLALGLGVGLIVLSRLLASAQSPPRPSSLRTVVWDFPQTPVGRMRAVVMLPAHTAPGVRLPLLVALHGWGETLRGVERGAFGWSRDYELGASDRELRMPALRREAFLGHVDGGRLTRLRRDLAARPYQGLAVVAPFTPDVLGADAGALQQSFDRWLVEALVPRARRELPVLGERAATGIDGVSLGGLHALEIGLAHPEVFGVVGALQPAVRGRIGRVLARYTPSPSRPAQRVRLVTSRGDVYRRDVAALSEALRARAVEHDVRVLAGPHDYVFNRGPGGVEMLLFHDRALRGLPAE
ncbi:MAG: alpha/beta hydrolase-fold protein [Deltaproteobacteria bacterium]|nr:alpha/beta hydrolase-fold protein [Myxococcales bacterium]MDP3218551.1 alpha/beta hydrolase-fold protein [Deltaproteobacteria bacterium]